MPVKMEGREAPPGQSPVYKPGDIVWAKLTNVPWWPAEVVAEEDFPGFDAEDPKPVVALIKTFQDNCMEIIKRQDKIAPFENPMKKNWIKKGELDRRQDIRNMFLPAVRQAEERLCQVPEPADNEPVVDQENREGVESCSSTDSKMESAAKPRRRGGRKASGCKKTQGKKSSIHSAGNRCPPSLPPQPPSPPPPPLPPSPPPSDQDVVRSQSPFLEELELPILTPPTKHRSPSSRQAWWRKDHRQSETCSACAKDGPAGDKSEEGRAQEAGTPDHTETLLGGDSCERTISSPDASTGDGGTSAPDGASGRVGRAVRSAQSVAGSCNKVTHARSKCQSPKQQLDPCIEEGFDDGGGGADARSSSPAPSESLPLPVTPVKDACSGVEDFSCSPVLSNCSESLPLPVTPGKDSTDSSQDAMSVAAPGKDSASSSSPDSVSMNSSSSSSSSSSGIITFPNLQHSVSEGEIPSTSQSGSSCLGASSSSSGSTVAGSPPSHRGGTEEEKCALESEDNDLQQLDSTSGKESSSMAASEDDLEKSGLHAESIASSQSLPPPELAPNKRKRGRPPGKRKARKKAALPPKLTKEEQQDPVKEDESETLPLAVSSSLPSPRQFNFTDKFQDGHKSDSDSDTELPDVLSLSPEELEYPQENDIVWVKFGRFPLWPSVVKKVMKVKKRIKKLKVAFLGEGPRCFNVKYTKKNVIYPFSGSQEYVDEGRKILKDREEDLKNFNKALQLASRHVNAEVAKALPWMESESNSNSEVPDAPMEIKTEEAPSEEKAVPERERTPRKKKGSTLKGVPAKKIRLERRTTAEKSRVLEERRQRNKQRQREQKLRNLMVIRAERKKRNQVIVDYIKSDATKTHLKDIFHGKVDSERHKQYFEGIQQRDKLHHANFGPIDDEDQQQEILEHLTEIFRECHNKLGHETYVLDVWIPEAVVYGMRRTKKQGPERAWERFKRGVPLMQVEHELLHEEISH